MSYHFYKAVFSGLVKADIISVFWFVTYIYMFGSVQMSDPTGMMAFKTIAIVYTCLAVATFYAYQMYRGAYRRARAENLDRVHPLPHGRTRRW